MAPGGGPGRRKPPSARNRLARSEFGAARLAVRTGHQGCVVGIRCGRRNARGFGTAGSVRHKDVTIQRFTPATAGLEGCLRLPIRPTMNTNPRRIAVGPGRPSKPVRPSLSEKTSLRRGLSLQHGHGWRRRRFWATSRHPAHEIPTGGAAKPRPAAPNDDRAATFHDHEKAGQRRPLGGPTPSLRVRLHRITTGPPRWPTDGAPMSESAAPSPDRGATLPHAGASFARGTNLTDCPEDWRCAPDRPRRRARRRQGCRFRISRPSPAGASSRRGGCSTPKWTPTGWR
jgi:hypothetical protein